MKTTPTTRRIASLGLASAAVTLALAGTATAAVQPHDPALGFNLQGSSGDTTHQQHDVLGNGHFTGGSGANPAPASSVDESNWEWAQVGYGAAGGVALFAAGAAGVVILRRRQQLPHHA